MKINKKSLWEKTKRFLCLKLVIPLKRSDASAVFGARGVMIGLMWAMTPLVGIQMTTVLITWAIARKIFKWDFSLPIALTFTWVTNVFTMWPIYYIFYASGKILMGDIAGINAYDSFIATAHSAFAGSVSPLEIGKAIMLFIGLLFKDWGTAMVVGCLPWALICGTVGYFWTYKWLVRYHARRANAEERRRYWREKIRQSLEKHKEKRIAKKEARAEKRQTKKEARLMKKQDKKIFKQARKELKKRNKNAQKSIAG